MKTLENIKTGTRINFTTKTGEFTIEVKSIEFSGSFNEVFFTVERLNKDSGKTEEIEMTIENFKSINERFELKFS